MSEKKAIQSYTKFIYRSDDAERKVTSIVADPVNIDSHGGSIRPEVIQRASDEFMEYFRNYGIGHVKDSDGNVINRNDEIILLENWVTRNDQDIEGVFVPKGAWIQTWRLLNDDTWQDVQRGELQGFSFVALTKTVKVK